MCFSIFSQFWGGISSHSAAARCTSEPEQYQSFSHLQDLLNSKMCWRWDVDRARRLLPRPSWAHMASPGGYSGWDGGGASHQFTLDLGEKALDNMTFLKSPSNFSSFKVFIYICWFPIYSPSPPPHSQRGWWWCVLHGDIGKHHPHSKAWSRNYYAFRVTATADNADCMNHPKYYTSGDCNEQLWLLQCSNSTVQYLS